MRTERRWTTMLLLALVSLLPAPALAGAAGEWTLTGWAASGDYGTGVDADTRALSLRYVTGDTFQFRVEVPWVAVRRTLGVTWTGAGPVPVDEGHRGEWSDWMAGHGGTGGHHAPLALAPVEAIEDPAGDDRWATGLGDVRVGIGRRLAGGGLKVYRLDAALEVKLPTADEDRGLGTGEWDARVGLSGEYHTWSISLFGGIGWNRIGDPDWIDFQDAVDGFVGLESEPLRGGLVLSGWLEGSGEITPGTGSRVALGAGLRLPLGQRLGLRVLGTAGLTDAAEDWSLSLGMSWGVPPSRPRTPGMLR